MRLFQNLNEAALEIRRDLAKSPAVHSSRVQGQAVEATAREATCYSYTVVDIPDSPEDIVDLGIHHGFYKPEDEGDWHRWLRNEREVRLRFHPGAITEAMNPLLKSQLEGQEPSYAYTDRLRGMVTTMSETLLAFHDTRRAYWPMFLPEDAVRSRRLTRIPCTIGYQFMIREVTPGDHRLHGVYLERSCDFDRFWLSDIWLARQMQRAVLYELQAQWHDDATYPNLGHTSHMIVSFHSFEQMQSEIY